MADLPDDAVPEHLRPVARLDAPVMAVYREVITDLLASDVQVRQADVPTVETAAVCLFALRRTAALLAASPPLLRESGDGGRVVRNPALLAFRDLSSQWATLSDRLGMSPRARKALTLDVQQTDEERRLVRLLS